ncbi:unnamed protein product, partial [Symbiodinium necroappetens]
MLTTRLHVRPEEELSWSLAVETELTVRELEQVIQRSAGFFRYHVGGRSHSVEPRKTVTAGYLCRSWCELRVTYRASGDSYIDWSSVSETPTIGWISDLEGPGSGSDGGSTVIAQCASCRLVIKAPWKRQRNRQVVELLCTRDRDCTTKTLSISTPWTRFVLFCSNHGHDQGLPPNVWRVAKLWRIHQEAGKVNMSLRAMGLFILGEIKKCAEVVYKDKQTKAQTNHCLNEMGQWDYLYRDPSEKKHKRNSDIPTIGREKVMEMLTLLGLEELLPSPNVVHRLHSLRPLTECSETMEKGLRASEAQEAYTILRQLSQLAITQPASLNLRPDKLQRSALANHIQQQIAKLS